MSARVVLIPNTMLSQGTGHLHRCSKAFAANPEHLALWTCLDPALLGTKELFSHDAMSTFLNGLATASTPAEGQYDVAVLDFQRTPPALLNWVKSRVSVVIGWDEGGVARPFFPFLVDSLPHESLPAPNVRLPGLLGYPEWEPSKTGGFLRPIRNVLVSFGGADVANLGGNASESVITAAAGVEVRPCKRIALRAAYELPLTDNVDLFGQRWTFSAVLKF